MSFNLVERVGINEITAGRDAAIAKWLEIYDGFHADLAEAASLSIGGALAINAPSRDSTTGAERSIAFLSSADRTRYDRESGEQITTPAREHFHNVIRKDVDRRCWSHLMDTLGFDQMLDRQAREEFANSLRDDPPEFTNENCASTFSHIWENQRDIYLRGIANAFMALDRRFRSHDGFKIGSRLIINGAFSQSFRYWTNYNRRDTLRDVERVFRELDGLGPCPESQSITELVLSPPQTPHVVNGDYFRVRIFGNGNLHIWFERKDLLKQVNLLLAEYYGETIGDGFDTTEADDSPDYHLTPAKNFGAFMSSDSVASRVMEYACIQSDSNVLEPSAGTGMLARAARERGANVSCIEIQPGLAHELRVIHGFDKVREADFLNVSPSPIYSAVVMNPPFDRGRDCDHVCHAWKFVAPGGVLVAVMSARAEYADDRRHTALRKIIENANSAYGRSPWHDLPPGSFAHAGTNVNTVILAIRKPYSA